MINFWKVILRQRQKLPLKTRRRSWVLWDSSKNTCHISREWPSVWPAFPVSEDPTRKMHRMFDSKFRRVHLRGKTLREARQGNLLLRGLRRGLSQRALWGSPRVLQGFSEGSAGLCGVLWGSAIFRSFSGGIDPMLVTLGICWTCMAPSCQLPSNICNKL